MGETVTMDGTTLQSDDRTVNQAVIECLERALEEARSGEIIGVCVASRYLDGAGGRSMAGIGSATMIGQMAIAMSELISDVSGQ